VLFSALGVHHDAVGDGATKSGPKILKEIFCNRSKCSAETDIDRREEMVTS